ARSTGIISPRLFASRSQNPVNASAVAGSPKSRSHPYNFADASKINQEANSAQSQGPFHFGLFFGASAPRMYLSPTCWRASSRMLTPLAVLRVVRVDMTHLFTFH